MNKNQLQKIKDDLLKKYAEYLQAEEGFAEHGRNSNNKPYFERFIKAKSDFKSAESKWQNAILSFLYVESTSQDGKL